MDEKKTPLYIRSKVWLADAQDNVVFGLGRLKMLEAIDKNGSLLLQRIWA